MDARAGPAGAGLPERLPLPAEARRPSVAQAIGGEGPIRRGTTSSPWWIRRSPGRDLEALAADSRLPVLVKGVLTAEDAVLAADRGAAGVIVSNHGGRQLDGVAATVDIVGEVAEAVGPGARC